MTITLNGKNETVDDQSTLATLIAGRSIDPLHTVVERNSAIVQMSEYDSTILSNGDTIELLCFVGGG